MPNLLRAGLLLGIAVSLSITGTAQADPGDLDSTFGGDGLVDVQGGAFQVAVAPGDGLWVAGEGLSAEGDPAVRITLLKQNGQPDPAFGDAGELVWSYPADGPYPATRVLDIAALAGGGVQISGTWCAAEGEGCADGRSFVARFDPSGAPVLGFGDGGVLTAPLGAFEAASLGGDESVHACDHDGSHQRRVTVRRYLPSGEPDPAFDGDGRVRVRIAGPSAYRRLLVCGASADGGTLVATMDRASSDRNALRAKKLTPSGEIDRSYGGNGVAKVSQDEIHVEHAVVSADGTAWFSGGVGFPEVLCLDTEGRRCDPFGGRDGIAVLDLPELARAEDSFAAVRSDGSVAVTGTLQGGRADDEPYVAMLTPEGVADSSFGQEGVVVGYAGAHRPRDIVIDGQDRVVTANSPLVIRFRA